MIFVGDTHGQTVSAVIQNLDVPGGDGFGGTSYPLSEGANKITARNKGLMYILYHTPDYETAQPVKIHIASGQVNGYFDVAKHQASDWNKLLSNAVDKYFDVVGHYAYVPAGDLGGGIAAVACFGGLGSAVPAHRIYDQLM